MPSVLTVALVSLVLVGSAALLLLRSGLRAQPSAHAPERRVAHPTPIATRHVERTERPVIVYGAGWTGHRLVHTLHADESAAERLVPVAILDDNPGKRNWRIEGVQVRGSRHSLARVVEATGARTLAVAIPTLPRDVLDEVERQARELGIEVVALTPTGTLGRTADAA